jgi:hypothetical protein
VIVLGGAAREGGENLVKSDKNQNLKEPQTGLCISAQGFNPGNGFQGKLCVLKERCTSSQDFGLCVRLQRSYRTRTKVIPNTLSFAKG